MPRARFSMRSGSAFVLATELGLCLLAVLLAGAAHDANLTHLVAGRDVPRGHARLHVQLVPDVAVPERHDLHRELSEGWRVPVLP
ncbi:hypothetical protein BHS07_31835 [Myxococcus xanthus]|nr:hypothetical protein BHS07_31835 [Myxococcus xanthus]QDF07667.1 hypothetical protein BHS04_31365 [Myxococcus xanthus]